MYIHYSKQKTINFVESKNVYTSIEIIKKKSRHEYTIGNMQKLSAQTDIVYNSETVLMLPHLQIY